MGIPNFFENLKNWAGHVVSGTETPQQRHQQQQLNEQQRRFPNLGEDISHVVQTPEFGQVLDAASPFLLASLGAWPGYWLYRGIDYYSHRAHVPLPTYIRQTFYQAKVLQFVIIMSGIITIINRHRRNSILLYNKEVE
ncbi:uncharacterized protein LOC6557665 [Drosophila grimshawi]|uniref:GH15760 n=1 Tax=Drosophila grimshawi TaxID=7222 RepID=B4IYM5_DROGR|nr:uncharacterized protein LOC6557665 [Drosophila grimshawi]EDV95535.1 GH15760 [Drosophila grimshawi]